MSHKTHNGRGPGEKFTFTCFLIEVSFGSLELYFDVFSKSSRKQDIEVRKNWLLVGTFENMFHSSLSDILIRLADVSR